MIPGLYRPAMLPHPDSSLTPFLPALVIRAMADPELRLPWAADRQGAVLLADIAGFTPLAEAMARRGARGAEELTALLDRVLGAMVERIESDGGSVIKFAGDALLAAWSGENLATSAHRAAAYAAALHEVVSQASRRAGESLSLSVGLAAGDYRILLLEGSPTRWDHVPVGLPLAEGITRRSPCPCGSGKRFKSCHGGG